MGGTGATKDSLGRFVLVGGTTVLIDAVVLKTGRTMAYVTVDLRREKDGVLIAQGRMTKFMA